jgi:hypothetical protein
MNIPGSLSAKMRSFDGSPPLSQTRQDWQRLCCRKIAINFNDEDKIFMQCNLLRGFLYLLLMFAFAQPALAQRLVARQLFDHARAIRVIGETAYVVSGSGLFIYDITDKAHPRLRSSLLINDNSSFDLEVSPPRAYVLSGELQFETPTLTVVNISNRAKPVILSQYQDFAGSQPNNFILRGETLIVANANRLEFLSVSDPRNVRKIGSLDVAPKGGVIQSLTSDDSVIFAGFRHLKRTGVVAVETKNPGNPQILSRINFAASDKPGPIRIGLTVSNHVLYLSRNGERVAIYDVSNPADPKTSGLLTIIASGLSAEGNVLFAEISDQRVGIFETSTPLSPRFVRDVEWFGTTAGMDFDPAQLNAFVQWTELGRSGFAILKLNNDGTFTLQSNLPAVFGSDVDVVGNITYLSGSNKLAAVRRVPGSKQIRELGNTSFFESLESMEVRNSRVYVSTVDSESRRAIRIVDVADPAHMQPLGILQLDPAEVPAGTTQARFDVEQNLLVLALRKTGLAIYDVSSGAFQTVSTFDTPNNEQALNATIQNGLAFLCTSRRKELNLYVIDIQNPARPTLITKVRNFDAGERINDLKADGNFLYVAGAAKSQGSGKLYIFSIATPDRTALLSKTFTGADPNAKSGDAAEIKIRGDLAYVADGVDGITIFDISDKLNPLRAGNINTPSFARGVSIDAQKQIHIADSTCYLLFR